MHIQDCLEEILHLEDTDLAASLADASRLFSCKKRQLVAKPDACSDWIPFLVSGVIRGYLTDEKGRDITDCFLYRPGEAVLSLSILTASFPINFEAVTDCVLLSIPTQLLAEQFQQSAELQQLYSSYLLEKLKLERSFSASAPPWSGTSGFSAAIPSWRTWSASSTSHPFYVCPQCL